MNEPSRHAVSAPARQVTVQEDRALVSRVAELTELAADARGQVRLTVEAVSPILVDKSLRVTSARPGLRVLDVRCRRKAASWRAGTGAPSDAAVAATAAVEDAKLRLEQARATVGALREEQAMLVRLRRAELADLALAAARGLPCTGAAEELARGDRELVALAQRAVEADQQVADRERELADAERLASQAQRRTGDDRAWLELDCVLEPGAAAPGPGLTIEYLVPAAAWRPAHRARLVDGAVDWELGACVWQRTGEDWRDVELVLSAERASLGVEPPELTDDELEVRPRPAALVVQTREQDLEHAGEGSAAAGAAEVMGIDDGGLGLTLRPGARCTVTADGRPHRVALGAFRAPAEVDLLAIPLHSPLCHVRARFANTGAMPLLAGPVDLLRAAGTVGRGEIGFLAAHEKVTLGFGSEPEVRVHREQREEQDDAGLLGGSITRTVRVIIRLSNLGASARQVVVQDRVPISELEQVVVTTSAPEAFRLDRERRPGEAAIPQITARAIDEHGIVTWVVPLPPAGRAAVALEYRIKRPRGVAGL